MVWVLPSPGRPLSTLLGWLAVLAAVQPAPVAGSGFEFVEISQPGNAPRIEAAVWYPAQTEPSAEVNTPFGQAVAMRAPVAGAGLPLVLISHGDGGWFGGHATLARDLAEAGMVAVALNHPGNSDGDETSSPGRWIAERPAHLNVVAAHMTTDWRHAEALATGQVGLFGFSAGGHSVLVAAGAVPSVPAMAAHCASRPDEFACAEGMVADVVTKAPRFPAPLEDVRAVVAVAPGFGFGFGPGGLDGMTAPVQIWAGNSDRRVPVATNVDPLAEALGDRADVRRVDGAGHFAFLQPCNPALEGANPRIWEMVCVDEPGFDRARFQEAFNAEIVAFFARQLLN